MKKFFKKLVGRGDQQQAASESISEETKVAETPNTAVIPCADGVHRQANFKCWNDHCQAILCFSCARPPNKHNQILCDLCHVS